MGKTWRSQKVQENETPQNTQHALQSHHDSKHTPIYGLFLYRSLLPVLMNVQNTPLIVISRLLFPVYWFEDLKKKPNKDPWLRVLVIVSVTILQLNCGSQWKWSIPSYSSSVYHHIMNRDQTGFVDADCVVVAILKSSQRSRGQPLCSIHEPDLWSLKWPKKPWPGNNLAKCFVGIYSSNRSKFFSGMMEVTSQLWSL